MAAAAGQARLFYDGDCALCHGAVRWLLPRDRERPALRFSPLGGDTARRMLPDGGRGLPDSVVALTPRGEVLTRWRAMRYLLRRCGPLGRLAAASAGLVPVRLGDALYDAVARRRRRWFGTAAQACPVLPEPLRARFDP